MVKIIEYTMKETGEVVELSHRWEYLKEGDTMEEIVFERNPVGASNNKRLAYMLTF